jgi:hypothetical protein
MASFISQHLPLFTKKNSIHVVVTVIVKVFGIKFHSEITSKNYFGHLPKATEAMNFITIK